MAQAATIDALRKGLTLDKPTDEMDCACPILRRMAIRLNDGNWWESDTKRTENLRPLISLLLDSRGDRLLTQRRIYFVVNHSVRVITPMRLEWIAINRPNQADQIWKWIEVISNLSPITDTKSAEAARDRCVVIRRAAAYAEVAAARVLALATIASAAAAEAGDLEIHPGCPDVAYAAAYAEAASASFSQRVKYRDSLLACFRACANLR